MEGGSTALARVNVGWQEFLAAFDGIPEERMTEPGAVGEWSVKDAMGHVAFWEGVAIDAVERRVAGQPDRELDVQASNDAESAVRRDRPLAAIRDELFGTHDRLLATVRTILDRDPALDATVCECIEADTYEHYAEHGDDIRAWRERNGI